MGQVYRFTDENGQVRLFAEIDPSPVFNGGTITSPLTIHDTADETLLTLTGSATQSNTVLQVSPHGSGSYLIMNADGTMELFSDVTVQNASLLLDDSEGGQVSMSSLNGVQVAPVAGPGNVLRATAASGATGNIALFSSSGGEFHIGKNAHPIIIVHAAPADGDLSAGECALWFDQTNGAAKLMVKAKSANGTVATGSVNLA